MKTIIVDHDTGTEIKCRARFNNIVPLLKDHGCTDIILADQISEYLNTDHKIIYSLTARIPKGDVDLNNDRQWFDDLTTEIPPDIIALANKELLHIAFFVGEIITITADQILETVNKQLLLAGINKSSITVYIPNFRMYELCERHLKFISIFEMSYHRYLLDSGLPLNDNVIQTVNLKPRNKKFTCLNHLNKTHRLAIASSLYNSNKHLDGYFSYHNYEEVLGEPEKLIIDAEDFTDRLPFLIDTDNREVVNYHWAVRKPFFTDAYWNFVTESFFSHYYGLTEKTFKPIVNLQPFIIFGSPGCLKALHKLGYETFHSVIDESYDTTAEHDRRMQILIKLAHWLVDMSDDEHIKMMTKIKPILEHNQNVFFKKNWKKFL